MTQCKLVVPPLGGDDEGVKIVRGGGIYYS